MLTAGFEGGSNSVVESQPSKLLVAGSIPVSRSSLRSLRELRLGKPPTCPAVARSARRTAWQASRNHAAARSAKADRLGKPEGRRGLEWGAGLPRRSCERSER